MRVRVIAPDERLGLRRGQTVVCIPVFGGHEHFVACLSSVLAHTAPEVPVLIADDASPDPRSARYVQELGAADQGPDRELLLLRREANLGFPGNANGAMALAAPADVVILNSDCVVADGWLEGLRAAAAADSRVATVTALTNHGTLVSVPERAPSSELPAGWSFQAAAAAVAAASLRLHPRIPTAVGHCVLIRRGALELVGDFDLAFSPGYGEEVDFSQRCLRAGLSHVVADDVYVLHHGGGSFAADGAPNPAQHAHEHLLQARYPYYHEAINAVVADPAGALARARGAGRRALMGFSVALDARVLTGPMTGTQLHVLELTAALARTERARIKVIVPPDLSDYAHDALAELEVSCVSLAEGQRQRADIVHRPFQVGNPSDLASLISLGDRVAVTHQDLISFHNPSYFGSFHHWEGYRLLTRRALAAADRVLFFSEHARSDALAEDLVEPARASVVEIGVDHTVTRPGAVERAPSGARDLEAEPETIVCLGTDFRHKNRLFAIRVAAELRRRGWSGHLLLVGPHVAMGSSRPEEAELLSGDPGLRAVVRDLGAVDEAEKEWLLSRARLVIYPSLHEGFGLVPFEAADHGVPCLWAPGTALSETLPDAEAGIVPWDAAASAEQALRLLQDEDRRRRNLNAIEVAAGAFSWDRTAERLLGLYAETCERPPTPGSAYERADAMLLAGVSEDALRLVGPDRLLPAEVERPLLALSMHPRFGRPVFRVMRTAYELSYRWRRRAPR